MRIISSYLIFVLGLMYVILVFSMGLISIGNFGDFNFTAWRVTPSDFYNSTYMNYPACIVVSLIAILMNPLYALFKFIYFLAHVGRKKEQ